MQAGAGKRRVPRTSWRGARVAATFALLALSALGTSGATRATGATGAMLAVPPPPAGVAELSADVPGSVWAIPDDAMPWTVMIDADVLDRLDAAAVRAGLRGWNGVGGTAFSLRVGGVTDDTRDRPVRDGVSRVHLRPDLCERGVAARAELYPGRRHARAGQSVVEVAEADIGLCAQRLQEPWKVRTSLLHEVGHVLGFDHPPQPDDEHGRSTRCAVMAPSLGRCMSLSPAERTAVAVRYPGRGPRSPQEHQGRAGQRKPT